jgi:hypothetical protein
MTLSLLTTLDNSITVSILKSKLESEGIPCFLHNEHFTNIMPHYFHMLGSGVRVMVPSDQLELAIEIAHLDQDMFTCPNCGSENITNSIDGIRNKIRVGLIAIFLAAPIGNLLNDYSCNDCYQPFKK